MQCSWVSAFLVPIICGIVGFVCFQTVEVTFRLNTDVAADHVTVFQFLLDLEQLPKLHPLACVWSAE